MKELNEYNDYTLGFTKGVIAAKQGIPELELLENEPNEKARTGIRAGYSSVTGLSLRDSFREFKKNYFLYQESPSKELFYNIQDAANDILDKDGCPYRKLLRREAQKQGKFLDSTGLVDRNTGTQITDSSEKTIAKNLGLMYISPKEREF